MTSATGSSQIAVEYEPFGIARTEVADDPIEEGPMMKFAGEVVDATSLYHLRARQYDPSTGRFLSIDPIEPGRMNGVTSRYVYAGDRPTTQIDPTGETFIPATAGQDEPRYVTTPASRQPFARRPRWLGPQITITFQQKDRSVEATVYATARRGDTMNVTSEITLDGVLKRRPPAFTAPDDGNARVYDFPCERGEWWVGARGVHTSGQPVYAADSFPVEDCGEDEDENERFKPVLDPRPWPAPKKPKKPAICKYAPYILICR